MKNAFVFFFLLVGNFCFSQFTIKATVLDSATKLPVPFSLVITDSHKFGVITNEKGEFELSLPDSLRNNHLEVSCIGYDTTEINIDVFLMSGKKEIFINSGTITLAIISISSVEQKLCKDIWGAHRSHAFGNIFFSSGNEVAVFIPNTSNDIGIISSLNYFIVDKGVSTASFRAKLYAVNPKNNGPGESLIDHDLILTALKGNSWVKFDIAQYNIAIPNEGFFVSMEWLPDAKNHSYSEEVFGKEFNGEGQVLGMNKEIKSNVTWYRPFLGKWYYLPNESHFNAMIGADVLIECK